MDIVFIKELCIETVIGIYDWERKIKQFVCIDLELGTDITDASSSDVINDTVDYKAVSKELKSFIGDSEFQLIEALAEESVKLIFKNFYINGNVKVYTGPYQKVLCQYMVNLWT